MQYVMPLKMLGEKGVFANPVSFNTIYHNIINVVPYMFNSFRVERNITKI